MPPETIVWYRICAYWRHVFLGVLNMLWEWDYVFFFCNKIILDDLDPFLSSGWIVAPTTRNWTSCICCQTNLHVPRSHFLAKFYRPRKGKNMKECFLKCVLSGLWMLCFAQIQLTVWMISPMEMAIEQFLQIYTESIPFTIFYRRRLPGWPERIEKTQQWNNQTMDN
jgi:hypothetical protein